MHGTNCGHLRTCILKGGSELSRNPLGNSPVRTPWAGRDRNRCMCTAPLRHSPRVSRLATPAAHSKMCHFKSVGTCPKVQQFQKHSWIIIQIWQERTHALECGLEAPLEPFREVQDRVTPVGRGRNGAPCLAPNTGPPVAPTRGVIGAKDILKVSERFKSFPFSKSILRA